MNATQNTATYPNRYAAYCDQRLVGYYPDRETARRHAEDGSDAEVYVAERHVELHCDAGQYVAIIVEQGSSNKTIHVTASNAGLIARGKAIDMAEKMGIPYRE